MGGRQYAFVHDRLRKLFCPLFPRRSDPRCIFGLPGHRKPCEGSAREGDANVSANVSANVEGTDDLVSYGHEEKAHALAHHYYSGRSPGRSARLSGELMAARLHHAYALELSLPLYVARRGDGASLRSRCLRFPAIISSDRGRLCVATWRNEEANRCPTQASEVSDRLPVLRASLTG